MLIGGDVHDTKDSLSAILRDVLLEEVDTDRLLVALGENAFAVPLNHARLADGSVAHDDNLRMQAERGSFRKLFYAFYGFPCLWDASVGIVVTQHTQFHPSQLSWVI